MSKEQEVTDIADRAARLLESYTPRTGEELIAHQQAFVNFQQMLFWFGALDGMAAMRKSPIIHAG
jgi:hypothetical protein